MLLEIITGVHLSISSSYESLHLLSVICFAIPLLMTSEAGERYTWLRPIEQICGSIFLLKLGLQG